MRSLNKTILSLLFLFITISCVTCPAIEELQRCKNELYEEFKNDKPLENLLHGFLNIEYDSVNWNEETDANEDYFRGDDILKMSARNYYYDLYNTAQEMGIPELLTPLEFCSTKHENHEEECLSDMEDTGCEANQREPDCFEKMYFRWVKKDVDNSPMYGTGNLSDEQLLEAICMGCPEFRNLPDDQLIKAFEIFDDVIYELSDESLLRIHFQRHHIRMTDHRRRRDYSSDSVVDEEDIRYFTSSLFSERSLVEARETAYGISSVSYADIIAEYKRRKNNYKYYDNLYADDICEKFRNSSWNTNNFKSREDFCEDYLTEE